MLPKGTSGLVLLSTTLVVIGVVFVAAQTQAQYLDDSLYPYRGGPATVIEKSVNGPVQIPTKHLHATIEVGELTIRGPLPEMNARQEVEAHNLLYRYCYESALVLNPLLKQGKAVLNAVVDMSGAIAYDQKILYKSDIPSFALEQCLKSSAWGWRFPATSKSSAVTVTLALSSVTSSTYKPAEHYTWKGVPLISIGAIQTNVKSKNAYTSMSAVGFSDRSMVEQVVRSKLSGIEYCYLKNDYRGEKKLDVRFTIQRDGTTSAIEITENPEQPKEDLAPCAHRMIRRWKFPALEKEESGVLEFAFASPVTIAPDQ